MAATIHTLTTLVGTARTLTQRDLCIGTWRSGNGGTTRYRIEDQRGSRAVTHYMTKGDCETWLRAYVEGAVSALGRYRVAELFRLHGNPYDPIPAKPVRAAAS
jgi:hypothetical protein